MPISRFRFQFDAAEHPKQSKPRTGYGYLVVKVRKKSMEFTFVLVQGNHRQPLETVLVPLS